jgi:DNA-3-methyladenine glycosylase II
MKNAAALNHISSNDAVLANIISTIEYPQIVSTGNVFNDLISCIVEQQIHYRSTKKIFQKMLMAAELASVTPENFSQFEEHGIASYSLSQAKYETLLGLIAFWNTHPQVNWQQLSDTEVRTYLSQIKGIGPWAMDMILLYTLERPTVFPADDFHLKEIMVKEYQLNPASKLKAQMLEMAKMWGEHTSLAVKYLLAWKAFHKKR